MFNGFDPIFRDAFSDALMKRWMDLDPDAALSSALAYREYGLKQPRLTFANAEADWLFGGVELSTQSAGLRATGLLVILVRMNRFALSLLTLTLSVGYSCLGADAAPEEVKLTREEVSALRSLDLEQIAKEGPALEGKVIRLKFNYRSASVRKADDGSLAGSLGIWKLKYRPSITTVQSATVSVKIPKEGAEWFMKIPSDEYSQRPTSLVVARITKNQGTPSAQLLGREVITDAKGSRVVW